jgi:CysZ protein
MFLKELFAGLLIYKKAHQVIMEQKLWPWIAVPGVMSFCYLLFLAISGMIILPGFSAYINESWIPGFMSGGVTYFMVSILLWLFLMIIGYLSYQQVVLLFFSPILGFISEMVEARMYDLKLPQFTVQNFVKDILRGLAINMRNFGWMLFFTGIAWLLCILPLVGALISTSLLLLIQSYYSGFGLVDYTLERKRFSVSGSIAFVHDHKARVTGVGMGFVLMLLIPVIGWYFAPGYGTVAATLSALEKIHDVRAETS